MINVDDPFARKWIRRDPDGKAWYEEMGFSDPVSFAPDRECLADDPRPILRFISPRDGDTVTSSPLEIWVIADATEWFDNFRLEYGRGDDPVDWDVLEERDFPANQPEMVYRWDLTELEEGFTPYDCT